MKKTALNALESQLTTLPYDQKKYLITLLSQCIESDAGALLDSTPDTLRCRHCDHIHTKRWGKSDGLQRYKCQSETCGKTFNLLTGTPLANLRYKSKWLSYLSCMMESLPLRQTAKRLGIDLTTAFRWRHRFLQLPTQHQPAKVKGIVEADETFFLASLKGQRNIQQRKARKRGRQAAKNVKAHKVPVLIVRDRTGVTCDFVLPELSKENVHQSLQPIVDKESILCSDGSSFYQTFAKKENIAHHRLIMTDNLRIIGKEFHIQNVNAYISRLKKWLGRFNGVATKYLPNYLGWRRLFESEKTLQADWLKLAAGL